MQQQFTTMLVAIGRGMARISRQQSGEGAVSLQQNDTLHLLAAHGVLSVGDVSSLLGIAPSTSSKNLTRLEKMGFITRHLNPAVDGRSTFIRLTPKGRIAQKGIAAGLYTACGSVLDNLTPSERKGILNALGIVARTIDPSTMISTMEKTP